MDIDKVTCGRKKKLVKLLVPDTENFEEKISFWRRSFPEVDTSEMTGVFTMEQTDRR